MIRRLRGLGAAILIMTMFVFAMQVLAAEDKYEILIGTHLPLSGMLAAVGAEQEWAYREAVRDINNKGGIFVRKYNARLPVRLLVVDDQTNPAVAAAAVESLIIQNKVDFILSGHTAAFGVIPGCVIAERHHKYYHATGCYTSPWLEHKFRYSTLFFYDLDQGATIPFLIWETLPLAERPKSIAILAEDTFDARVMTDASRIKAFERKYEVTLEMYWAPQREDFAELVEKLTQSGAESLFVFGTTTDCVKLIRQIRQAEVSLKYIHCWRGAWSAKFWEELGTDAQHIFFDGHWSMDYPFDDAEMLGKRYQTEFADKSVSVGLFYATAQILFQAIEEAGTLDAMRVRQAIIMNKFATVMGPVQYNDQGVALYESTAFQWVNGKPKLIYPFNLAQDRPLFPQTEAYAKE